MDADTLHQAKQIITEEVERAGYRVVKIILFGSRARGEARSDSDWDFLVVVDDEVPCAQKWEISDQIRLRFVQEGFWGDVFIEGWDTVQQQRSNTGYLTYYALKEGVEV